MFIGFIRRYFSRFNDPLPLPPFSFSSRANIIVEWEQIGLAVRIL